MGRYPGAFAFWTELRRVPQGSTHPAPRFPRRRCSTRWIRAASRRWSIFAPSGRGLTAPPTNTIDDGDALQQHVDRGRMVRRLPAHLGERGRNLRQDGRSAVRVGDERQLVPLVADAGPKRYFDLGNSAASYRFAWRHVYTIIHAIAPNVKFFWCPTVTGIAGAQAYFPGAAYVDYIGVDGYGRGPVRTMASVLAPALARIRAIPVPSTCRC